MPTQSKSFKFRLYPTKVQADLMQRTFGCVRLVYNTVLARNLDGYKEHGKDWRNQFNPTYLKKQFDFLSEVSAATLQQSARNLQSAYEGWFKSLSGKRKGKKLSRPKFKSKHGSRKSFTLTLRSSGLAFSQPLTLAVRAAKLQPIYNRKQSGE